MRLREPDCCKCVPTYRAGHPLGRIACPYSQQSAVRSRRRQMTAQPRVTIAWWMSSRLSQRMRRRRNQCSSAIAPSTTQRYTPRPEPRPVSVGHRQQDPCSTGRAWRNAPVRPSGGGRPLPPGRRSSRVEAEGSPGRRGAIDPVRIPGWRPRRVQGARRSGLARRGRSRHRRHDHPKHHLTRQGRPWSQAGDSAFSHLHQQDRDLQLEYWRSNKIHTDWVSNCATPAPHRGAQP